jgi:flagellar basal body-associated protein FliL
MAAVIKLILLVLVILFLVTVVRIAFSVLRLLSLPMDKHAQKQHRQSHDEAPGSGPARTIELDKKDYKVE